MVMSSGEWAWMLSIFAAAFLLLFLCASKDSDWGDPT